jgi:outer membrane protein assembly factor BamE (lipoprotein component of BamABCDE complex)
MRMRRLRLTSVLLGLVALALVVALEVKLTRPTITPGITPQNFAYLHKGMTREDVEAVLGPPTKVGELILPSWYTLVWQDDRFKRGLEDQKTDGGCWIEIKFWGSNTSSNPQDQQVLSRQGFLQMYNKSQLVQNLQLAEQADPFLVRWRILPTAGSYVAPPSTKSAGLEREWPLWLAK